MILIISALNDRSTCEVIDWLFGYQMKTLRINGFFASDNATLRLNDSSNIFFYENIPIENIKSIWYRKVQFQLPNNIEESLPKEIVKHKTKEAWEFYVSMRHHFYKTKKMGQIESKINKYHALQIAKYSNICIPDTLITNSRLKILQFLKQYPKTITKCIWNTNLVRMEDKNWAMYASMITEELIRNLPEKIFPSLIQEYIEKEYEVRVFYLEGKCYSMAVFSQNDAQTKIDFRKYNHAKPNRTVPYKFPADVEKKVIQLMEQLNLNTGSLDFIRATDGRYVFLEVNPEGQFGMVSKPCNYYLEKKIADFLAN